MADFVDREASDDDEHEDEDEDDVLSSSSHHLPEEVIEEEVIEEEVMEEEECNLQSLVDAMNQSSDHQHHQHHHHQKRRKRGNRHVIESDDDEEEDLIGQDQYDIIQKPPLLPRKDVSLSTSSPTHPIAFAEPLPPVSLPPASSSSSSSSPHSSAYNEWYESRVHPSEIIAKLRYSFLNTTATSVIDMNEPKTTKITTPTHLREQFQDRLSMKDVIDTIRFIHYIWHDDTIETFERVARNIQMQPLDILNVNYPRPPFSALAKEYYETQRNSGGEISVARHEFLRLFGGWTQGIRNNIVQEYQSAPESSSSAKYREMGLTAFQYRLLFCPMGVEIDQYDAYRYLAYRIISHDLYIGSLVLCLASEFNTEIHALKNQSIGSFGSLIRCIVDLAAKLKTVGTVLLNYMQSMGMASDLQAIKDRTSAADVSLLTTLYVLPMGLFDESNVQILCNPIMSLENQEPVRELVRLMSQRKKRKSASSARGGSKRGRGRRGRGGSGRGGRGGGGRGGGVGDGDDDDGEDGSLNDIQMILDCDENGVPNSHQEEEEEVVGEGEVQEMPGKDKGSKLRVVINHVFGILCGSGMKKLILKEIDDCGIMVPVRTSNSQWTNSYKYYGLLSEFVATMFINPSGSGFIFNRLINIEEVKGTTLNVCSAISACQDDRYFPQFTCSRRLISLREGIIGLVNVSLPNKKIYWARAIYEDYRTIQTHMTTSESSYSDILGPFVSMPVSSPGNNNNAATTGEFLITSQTDVSQLSVDDLDRLCEIAYYQAIKEHCSHVFVDQSLPIAVFRLMEKQLHYETREARHQFVQNTPHPDSNVNSQRKRDILYKVGEKMKERFTSSDADKTHYDNFLLSQLGVIVDNRKPAAYKEINKRDTAFKGFKIEDSYSTLVVVYAMLGTYFISRTDPMNINIFLFIIGQASAGKSCLLDIYEYIYKEGCAKLNPTGETTFLLESVLATNPPPRIVLCHETPPYWTIPKPEFLSWVFDLSVRLARKNKSSVDINPGAKGLFAGNYFPLTNSDGGAVTLKTNEYDLNLGAMTRRCMKIPVKKRHTGGMSAATIRNTAAKESGTYIAISFLSLAIIKPIVDSEADIHNLTPITQSWLSDLYDYLNVAHTFFTSNGLFEESHNYIIMQKDVEDLFRRFGSDPNKKGGSGDKNTDILSFLNERYTKKRITNQLYVSVRGSEQHVISANFFIGIRFSAHARDCLGTSSSLPDDYNTTSDQNIN